MSYCLLKECKVCYNLSGFISSVGGQCPRTSVQGLPPLKIPPTFLKKSGQKTFKLTSFGIYSQSFSGDTQKFLPRFFQKAKGIAFFGRRKSLVAILGTTSPWQDFKGCNPLTPQNFDNNHLTFNRSDRNFYLSSLR